MYANVLVQYGVKSLDHTFTYHIPDELIDLVEVGRKVHVPFGNQKINGFVVGISNEPVETEVKDIIDVVTKELKLNTELLELGKYIKEKTLCSLISAYQTMLPTSMKVSNSKEDYNLNKTYIEINATDNEINAFINTMAKKAKKQVELLELIYENGTTLKKEVNSSSLKKLLELGLVKEVKRSEYRINPIDILSDEYKLNNEQESAFNKIKESFNTNKTFLLHGITGSGKTEVYMHLISEVIKQDKCAIMLVPEISLTTQIVERFYSRFGSDVAIFHSSLSDGEKYDEYKKIMNGEVHVVVGTRSAIFTPVKSLGLIIIDEEHSTNYKQENNPKYHALDMAKWRSNYHNCPLILGSATPSLETMARAQKGVYEYLTLNKRIGSSILPKINIVDMSLEYKKRNMILSEELQVKIMKTLEKHEQVMLLINRRGYSTFMTCLSCGFTYKCPHCDISLTYHKSSNHLRCHYCGYTVIKSDICPNCHEKAIGEYGLGTEKVEEFVSKLYPSYKVVRMDTDTTSRKGMHSKIIKAIENHEYDIIIGTQMIAKGLDFPRVTLVGVINADESLNIPDFRSGEATFSLLTQVSGRAGRSDLRGEVIIQTFNPDNKTLQYVKENDYLGNYIYEMNVRHMLNYPPYCYLISMKITSKEYEEARNEANKIAVYLRKELASTSIVLGPTTASPFKINNNYRFQVIIKYKKDPNLNKTLEFIDKQYSINKKISLDIDIDPLRI